MDLQFKAADGSKRYKITKIYVPEGGSFQAGAPLLKAESGQMNTVVKAEQAGTLKKLLVKEGQEIGSGEIFAQAEYAAGTSAAGGQRGTVGRNCPARSPWWERARAVTRRLSTRPSRART